MTGNCTPKAWTSRTPGLGHVLSLSSLCQSVTAREKRPLRALGAKTSVAEVMRLASVHHKSLQVKTHDVHLFALPGRGRGLRLSLNQGVQLDECAGRSLEPASGGACFWGPVLGMTTQSPDH